MWIVGGTVEGTGVRAQGGRICSEWGSGGLFLRAKLQTALVQPTPSVPRVCNEVWETSDPNQSIFPCNPEGGSGYSSSTMRKGREEGIEGTLFKHLEGRPRSLFSGRMRNSSKFANLWRAGGKKQRFFSPFLSTLEFLWLSLKSWYLGSEKELLFCTVGNK